MSPHIRKHRGSIALLLTSDEEGVAVDGTVRVVEALQARGEKMDYCIVGEPTSVSKTGDTIKNGRRGSLSGTLTVKGVQGHIAYPHLVKNPIHLAAPAIAELAATEWDNGNEYFPADLLANLQHPRRHRRHQCRAGHGGNHCSTSASPPPARWTALNRASMPSSTSTAWNTTCTGRFRQALSHPARQSGGCSQRRPSSSVTGIDTELSTSGGTSDGRFIADICPQVIELGPFNATIHKLNECVAVADLDALSEIYYLTLRKLLAE